MEQGMAQEYFRQLVVLSTNLYEYTNPPWPLVVGQFKS
jgi:hypothetical protein